jgi:hypothetical protein
MRKLDSIDREFNDFLDSAPIYNPELMRFNQVTGRAYADRLSEEYKRKLAIIMDIDDDEDAYNEIRRRGAELKWSILEMTGSDPPAWTLEDRRKAQRAHDRLGARYEPIRCPSDDGVGEEPFWSDVFSIWDGFPGFKNRYQD